MNFWLARGVAEGKACAEIVRSRRGCGRGDRVRSRGVEIMRILILLEIFLALMIVRYPSKPISYQLLAAVLVYLVFRGYIARFGTESQREFWRNIDRKTLTDNRVSYWIVVLFGLVVVVGIVSRVLLH